MDQQISSRLADLEERVAALEGKPAKRAAARVPQEGASVSYPIAASAVALPTTAELHKLLAIVQAQCPQLAPDFHDELDFFDGFCRAFSYVVQLGRSDELHSKAGISWWLDVCRGWLRERNVHGDVLASSFAAAALASGAMWSPKDPAAGTVWQFGLRPHGGRPDSNGWRAVLAAGRIREPVVDRARREARPVMVTVGAEA